MPVTLTAPGGMNFFDQDVHKTLLTELHAATPELNKMEQEFIIGRTPILTGSLALDTSGTAYPSINTNVLVELYPSDEEQLAEYGSVYAQYVEGGPLGASSSKISSPSEMYNRVLTDDIDPITEWGNNALQKGADRFMAGGGEQ